MLVFIMAGPRLVMMGASGLVVKSNVAIVGPWVRFPAGAFVLYFLLHYLLLLPTSINLLRRADSPTHPHTVINFNRPKAPSFSRNQGLFVPISVHSNLPLLVHEVDRLMDVGQQLGPTRIYVYTQRDTDLPTNPCVVLPTKTTPYSGYLDALRRFIFFPNTMRQTRACTVHFTYFIY